MNTTEETGRDLNARHLVPDALKIIFVVGKVIGVFPLDKRGDGYTFRVLSVTTAWSFLVWVLILFANIRYLYWEINVIIPTISSAVNEVSEIFYMLHVLIAMFLHVSFWMKMPRTLNYWDDWMRIQMESVFNEKFQSSRMPTWYLNFITLYYLITIFWRVFLAASSSSSSSSATNLIQLVTFTSHYFVLSFWVFNCSLFSAYAMFMRKIMRTTIKENSSATTSYRINRCAYFWVRSCDLVKSFNSLYFPIFLANLLFYTTVLISACNSIWKSDGRCDFVAYQITFSTVFCIFIYCEASHKANERLNFEMKEKILRCDLTLLDVKCQNEIWTFLQAIYTQKLNITISNVINMDRSLLISIFSIIITYLIVMRQLDQI